MEGVIRDSAFGQLLRFVTRNRVLLYPEEKPGFQIPGSYTTNFNNHDIKDHPTTQHPHQDCSDASPPATSVPNSPLSPTDLERLPTEPLDLEKAESTHSSKLSGSHIDAEQRDGAADQGFPRPLSPSLAQQSHGQDGGEAMQQQISRTKSLAIVPTRTGDGKILADWYVIDDPANPQNWSPMKKAWTALVICESLPHAL